MKTLSALFSPFKILINCFLAFLNGGFWPYGRLRPLCLSLAFPYKDYLQKNFGLILNYPRIKIYLKYTGKNFIFFYILACGCLKKPEKQSLSLDLRLIIPNSSRKTWIQIMLYFLTYSKAGCLILTIKLVSIS